MRNPVFKNDASHQRMIQWYQRFLERSDLKTESAEVATSFGKSHVLLAGDASKPTLVCLHAMMTSSAHLLAEIGPLLEHFRIIAPDIPGQSVKGLPVHLSYSDNSHAVWLSDILKAMGLEKIHLFGVSLGGFVARQFASGNPEKIKTLTLLVPAGIVQGSLVKGFTKMAFPMILYKLRPSEKRLRKLTSHLLTTWDDDWARYLGDAFNDFKPNLKIPPLAGDHELKQLSMPCLVIGAEYDISFPGKLLLERVHETIPGVETELLKNSRHSPPTTPEFRNWLAERIMDFTKVHEVNP